MNDQFARLAQDTVERASRARLTIQGGSLSPDRPLMGLHADNGWPVFWCDLGSAVAAAAKENRTAVLTVFGPADAAETVTVLLTGRLEMIGRSSERGRQVGAIMLVPARVLVETCVPGRPAVSRAVLVEDYSKVGRVGLSACAARIAEHTNSAHGDLLRCFAAGRAGVPAAQVAAAWLTGLGDRGAQVEWVDLAGAHATTATFPRQARTATELALLLREQLSGGPAGPGHEGPENDR